MASLENRANILGDVRAENDRQMLDQAFFEWQDYKILFEADDRFVVVGRRGTGKSALTYRLQKEWREKKYFVVVVAPDEEDVFGLRSVASRFGTTVTRVRAAIKTAWRFAMAMEIALQLHSYYKTKKAINDSNVLLPMLKWEKSGANIISRLRATLRACLQPDESMDDAVSELASRLDVNAVVTEVDGVLARMNRKVMVIVDRLDEGYESDDIGIGIVDGIIYGADDLRNKTENIKSVLFLRDNIFRAIQMADQDFTRNIEGSVLRLHWDTQELFYLVCKRLRAAFGLTIESDIKLWNSITSNELHGREGFRVCLNLTLYRPRDLISLLNTAFHNARKQDRQVLIPEDLQASATHISSIRYDDLRKEYSSVFPGIGDVTKAVGFMGPKLTLQEGIGALDALAASDDLNRDTDLHMKILGGSEEVLKTLYGIGFVGVEDDSSGNYLFSHDGKKPERLFDPNAKLLVHPCYWNALGIQDDGSTGVNAQEIFDEYEITISSQVKEQRDLRIGRMITELSQIAIGLEDAAQFEDWCKRAIDLIAARRLANIQLKPNGNAAARRDIVATNNATEGFWRRIREDYGSRQVVFEVKNYERLGIEEYRQANSYLVNEYGRFAFIICRDKQKELSKGADLDAFREFYQLHKSMIVKVTATFIVSLLSKLRSPQKYDAADEQFEKHLDTHIRLYASGQSDAPPPKRGRSRA
ncbi:P-loop ATPase, Sll1717 family [Burkholderia sp. Se-20378]|uniref:P-loop ATPase, Sll1717 family n=1 Tax=Burkholderia sp. Se-20378 TaxID=2703899 RepID=UPI00197FD073|nr:ATP-binding protein [Burkholderia sp. Se-20378]MBN3768332.1 ATP-binding protein [Burkholderia sp. Se-20378]